MKRPKRYHPSKTEVEQAVGLFWPETERLPDMTQQFISPQGNMVTVPDNADPYAAYQASYEADAGNDLPANTSDTRALAGTPERPGPWYQVTRIWGPKDLGKGPVLCAELTDGNSLTERLYFGGLIEPKLAAARAGIEAGLFFWFRYVYHADFGKAAGPYYSAEGKFAPEPPAE